MLFSTAADSSFAAFAVAFVAFAADSVSSAALALASGPFVVAFDAGSSSSAVAASSVARSEESRGAKRRVSLQWFLMRGAARSEATN